MLSLTSTPSIRNTLSNAKPPEIESCPAFGVLSVRPGESSAMFCGVRPSGRPSTSSLRKFAPTTGLLTIGDASACDRDGFGEAGERHHCIDRGRASERDDGLLVARRHAAQLDRHLVVARRQPADDVVAVDVGNRRSRPLQCRRCDGHRRAWHRQAIARRDGPGDDACLQALCEDRRRERQQNDRHFHARTTRVLYHCSTSMTGPTAPRPRTRRAAGIRASSVHAMCPGRMIGRAPGTNERAVNAA